MSWFELGKKRSRLGAFIDMNGITQGELTERSGVSRATITKLCNEESKVRNRRTAESILKALKELTGRNVKYDDFWV